MHGQLGEAAGFKVLEKTNLGFSLHLCLTEILMGALEESYSWPLLLCEPGTLPIAEIKWMS